MKIIITNDSLMYNRGSEAVIRGTVFIVRFWYPNAEIIVVTGSEGECIKSIPEATETIPKFDARGGISYLLKESKNADIVLVTGADNYDYGFDNLHMIEINNKLFDNTHAKMILFDCSLNEKNLSKTVKEDISRFDFVTTRETYTYSLFAKYFGKEKIGYYPDPAFVMPMEKCGLPYGFEDGNTVGINISNLIMGKRVGAPEDIVISNYKKVIEYLLFKTNYKILLIQHVLNNGFDLDATKKLYKGYEDEERIIVMQAETVNAVQLKYIISHLNVLLTARTHASIAAYSTNVPTFVVGYSVKSFGIAEDLFGSSNNYVVGVRELNTDSDLLEKFKFVLEKQDDIRDHLFEMMPKYKIKTLEFGEVLKK